jgi:hypothetical protein
VAGGQESGGEVAGKLLRDDVVLVVCAWPGPRGSRLSGRRRGRAAVEARAHRHYGPGNLAWENEIGRACELQWVTGMLLEH